ncbi:MAG: sialidase family protein [Methylocystis sp.]
MRALTLALLASLATVPAQAEDPRAPAANMQPSLEHAGHEHAGHMGREAPPPACAEAKPRCAQTADPTFTKDGRLWLAFSVGDKIYAASSRDNGQNFDPAVVVATATGGVIDANGEARPKIVALADGALLVSYTARPEKSYNGSIWIARSTDGGKSFSAAQPLVDGVGQRFDIFLASPKGRLYAAWLDKRDAEDAKKAGKEFAGSGIAVGWSDDGGKTFAGKKILSDHSCECCRVSAAFDRDGLPVFAWRQVFEANLRDHYVAKLSADGSELRGGRVSEDDWATNCPHHGPSLAIDAAGAWHVVWFTNGKNRKGLFYAKSVDGGKSFTEPSKFGDDERTPAHPAVLAVKGHLYRVWKEFDGTTTSIVTQMSQNAGKAWSNPRVVASTIDASDHPLLIEHKGGAYLSWLTHEQGYRLLPLPREQATAEPTAHAAALTGK